MISLLNVRNSITVSHKHRPRPPSSSKRGGVAIRHSSRPRRVVDTIDLPLLTRDGRLLQNGIMDLL